uniref:Uncharacterized protein n=1 Tax=Glossina pallidipes TaxID=7398 RepID=A0A1A9ZKB7_GLOPL
MFLLRLTIFKSETNRTIETNECMQDDDEQQYFINIKTVKDEFEVIVISFRIKNDDILCVDDIIQIPANTCSNCYLQQQQQQQQQQHQQQQNQHEHEYPVGYLGGGSTRDMRHSERSAVSNVSSPMQDQAAGVLNNTTFLYYKQPTSQQPHQHQQHQLQRQSFHLAPEHMDTDEECFQGASASLHSMQQPKATRKIPTTSTVASSGCADVAVGDGGCPAMLLDNNYGRYNFVDDKNLKNSTSTFTNTTTTITTTTTTTTDNHNKENNNNNIANNNSNNNNNNKSNSNYYTSNNRHHMTKISLNKCHSMELMHQQMQQLQEQEQEQEQQTATTTHLQHLQHYEHKPTNHHMHANHNIANHYFSIEPLLKANRKNKESIECHEDEKKKEGEEGVFYVTSSKLSYHSPRQDDNSCSFINTKINPNIANTNNTANANVTAATRLSNPIANCNDALINGEIDYEFTSRFRHSTPTITTRVLMRHLKPPPHCTNHLMPVCRPLRQQQLRMVGIAIFSNAEICIIAPVVALMGTVVVLAVVLYNVLKAK